MHLNDFDYHLPQELIAQHPPSRRRDARLLAVGATLRAMGIVDLPGLLRAGDLVVLNDTRVIPARLYGKKDSGGAVEILIERLLDDHHALAHIRASKSPKAGSRCILEPAGDELLVGQRQGDLFELQAPAGTSLAELLARCGHMPLPPYITRDDERVDAERYQTVFARTPGAVAAPTAGLHLDQALLDEIAACGVAIATLTLHVGAGTFQPVRGESIEAHQMHEERFVLSEELCRAVAATRERGGRVVAVGTTVARALESGARHGLPLRPYEGETRLFIREGFEFQVVDALLTNFHLPRSTLLMLVSAFAGHAEVMAAYAYAIEQRFRFFSYGDAMWLVRKSS